MCICAISVVGCCCILMSVDLRGNLKEIQRRPWKIRGTTTSLVYLLGAISKWLHAQCVHLYKSINAMGQYDCQTTKVSKKCKSISERQEKDFMKMLRETGTKISISTVKGVFCGHNLKRHSARKKLLLENHHKNPDYNLNPHIGTRMLLSIEMSLWSDVTKIELLGL